MTKPQPIENFPRLEASAVCRSVLIKRIPGIDVARDKAEALRRLESVHREIRDSLGIGDWPLATAEQVHGAEIAIVNADTQSDRHFPGCDGLVTDRSRIALGIHVADCCAVYIVDPKKPAIGLVHSGRKGTEANIVGNAIEQLHRSFGSNPADLIVQLSPCIRPPHYENDFAAQIISQCHAAGVGNVYDTGTCTACHLDSYYSYRAEKGKTGRMLALLGLLEGAAP